MEQHEETGTAVVTGKSKSGLATASLLLGISGFILGPLCLLAWIAGMTCGVLALRKIRESGGAVTGKGMAVGGIVTSGIPMLLIAWLVYWIVSGTTLHSRSPKEILEAGRLAGLPASAREVKVESCHNLFAGEDYLMFKADPEDIEQFLQESAIIKDVKPTVFSVEKQYLPAREDPPYGDIEDTYWKQEHFDRHEWPEWYDLTSKRRGRLYEIPMERGHYWGRVIVNDETHTVYVWVCWS